MAKGPDPRQNAAPLDEVPQLLHKGVDAFHERRFWDAHEAWEEGWHALRVAGDPGAAEFLHGLILCAAALENATRGKEEGFKRQFAEGLYLLRTRTDGAESLGIAHAPRLLDALALLYVDACRRRDWTQWNASGWSAPTLELA